MIVSFVSANATPLLGAVSGGDITTLVSESGNTYTVQIEYIDSNEVKLNVNGELTPNIWEGKVFNFVSGRFSIEIIDLDYLPVSGAIGSVTFWIFETYLEEGVIKEIVFEGKSYNVSIDYIDSNQVKLYVNEELTPPIQEGESYLLSDGVKIGILNLIYLPVSGFEQSVVLRMFNSSSLFDNVNVLYAARIIVDPVLIDTSDLGNAWLIDIVGGENKPVEVLYGVVELVSGDYSLRQRFIGLGPIGSDKSTETFLSEYTSIKTDINNLPYIDVSIMSFLSIKQLDGVEIVRNYSGSINATRLLNNFSDDGSSFFDISLSSHYFETYSDIPIDFYSYRPKPLENYWQADMSTLIETGDITLISKYY